MVCVYCDPPNQASHNAEAVVNNQKGYSGYLLQAEEGIVILLRTILLSSKFGSKATKIHYWSRFSAFLLVSSYVIPVEASGHEEMDAKASAISRALTPTSASSRGFTGRQKVVTPYLPT